MAFYYGVLVLFWNLDLLNAEFLSNHSYFKPTKLTEFYPFNFPNLGLNHVLLFILHYFGLFHQLSQIMGQLLAFTQFLRRVFAPKFLFLNRLSQDFRKFSSPPMPSLGL